MDAIATPRPPLAYKAAGAGLPVLLVHGLLSDSRLWAPVAERLATHYRAIRCDLRGRGQSPRVPGLGPADHVGDLLRLVEHLRLSSLHLAGHGSGCSAAAGLALRLGRRVRSLTVIDPVIPRTGPRAMQETWHLEMLLQWLAVGHGPEVRQPEHVAALQMLIAQQTHAHMGDGPDLASGTDQLAPAANADLSRLTQLACPLLALIGQRAEEELTAVAISIFRRAPSFQLRRVPSATRRSPMEAPAEVATLLQEFLVSLT